MAIPPGCLPSHLSTDSLAKDAEGIDGGPPFEDDAEKRAELLAHMTELRQMWMTTKAALCELQLSRDLASDIAKSVPSAGDYAGVFSTRASQTKLEQRVRDAVKQSPAVRDAAKKMDATIAKANGGGSGKGGKGGKKGGGAASASAAGGGEGGDDGGDDDIEVEESAEGAVSRLMCPYTKKLMEDPVKKCVTSPRAQRGRERLWSGGAGRRGRVRISRRRDRTYLNSCTLAHSSRHALRPAPPITPAHGPPVRGAATCTRVRARSST